MTKIIKILSLGILFAKSNISYAQEDNSNTGKNYERIVLI